MRWGLWTNPHVQQSPSPTPQHPTFWRISWKRRAVFPGRPWDGDCGTPCGNLLLINSTEPRTLCRSGSLSAESGLHLGARGLPGPAPPLLSLGCTHRVHREGQGGRAWRPPRDKAQLSQQTRGAGSSPGLPPRSSGTLFPTSPPPPPLHLSLCGVGGGDPCKGLCRAPRGHPGDWL